jgi:hypothetical protein
MKVCVEKKCLYAGAQSKEQICWYADAQATKLFIVYCNKFFFLLLTSCFFILGIFERSILTSVILNNRLQLINLEIFQKKVLQA